jgi:RNA polymerase sigma-70 factor (ECF subfamily)
MTDDDLLRRVQRGDRAALEELCRLEWRPVYDLVYRTVQNRAEAQDLTQEVFLRALRSIDRVVDTGRPLHSWFVTIALNLLRDRWRRRPAPSANVDSLPFLTSTEPGPEQLVLADLDRATIRAALASLPDDYQTVIRLRVLEGRSSPEVAALMGRNADAVRQLQRRALLAMRAALREESLA